MIEGTVTDPQGALVPGARATTTSKVTNSSGYYWIVDLAPGMFQARTMEGFSTQGMSQIQALPTRVIRVDANLESGQAQHVVEVTAQPAQTACRLSIGLVRELGPLKLRRE